MLQVCICPELAEKDELAKSAAEAVDAEPATEEDATCEEAEEEMTSPDLAFNWEH